MLVAVCMHLINSTGNASATAMLTVWTWSVAQFVDGHVAAQGACKMLGVARGEANMVGCSGDLWAVVAG